MPEASTLTTGSKLGGEDKRAYQRAWAAMLPYQPTWRLALAFFDNHQYAQINANTTSVVELETAEGGAKPDWLQRPVRNRYTSGCVRECALLSSRAPAPECTPRSGDPEKGYAAKLAESVCLYLYEHLGMDTLTTGQLITAANTGAAYLWPHWDSQTGDYLGESDKGSVYEGEIAFLKLQPDEVLWERGYEFQKAPRHFVQRAYPVDQVMARPGYIGPAELQPDATGRDNEIASNPAAEDLKDQVFVVDMLERPSAKHKRGRWLTFLRSGEIIQAERPYPRDPKESGNQPCLHELPWLRRDHRHRPMGAGEQAIDIQRTRNRTIAQITMWKNLVLNPQMMAPFGSLLEEPSAEPGAVVEYRPVAGQVPQWRTVPEIPQTLFTTVDQCDADMAELFGTWDLPDTESAQHMAAAIERDRERRALQAKELARWYSGLFMHLLELVRRHYTAEMLMPFQGRFAVETIEGFKGTDLLPVNVRVTPGSIEGRTRAAQNAIVWQLFEAGHVPMHQAMAAINAGTAQKLIDSYELQIAKQYREIDAMIALAQEDASGVPSPDEIVYQLVTEQGVDMGTAGDMANEILQGAILEMGPQVGDEDDHEIHADVLSQWMVTRDFELQPQVVQGVARAHLAAHRGRLLQDAQTAAMMTSQRAEMSGNENAARPGEANKPEPSEPSMASQKEGMQ